MTGMLNVEPILVEIEGQEVESLLKESHKSVERK